MTEKQKEYQRRWISKNRDHINLWRRLYRKKNKKKEREIKRRYYQKHKNVILNYQLLCYWAFVHGNPEKMAEKREYGNRYYAKLSERKITKRLIKIRWEKKHRPAQYQKWKASPNYQAYLERLKEKRRLKRLEKMDVKADRFLVRTNADHHSVFGIDGTAQRQIVV